MRHRVLVLGSCLLSSFYALVPLALAQTDARPRLMPITAPIRHAGVYHVATGNWTRGASLANAIGPDVIYDNTCALVYFTSMLSCERFQHRSRIPSTSGPTTDSQFYGSTSAAHRYDERPGCRDAYTINGFEVLYCTGHIGTLDWEYQFASHYADCAGSPMVPDATITVTGLPGAASSPPTPMCWVVDIDLAGLPGGGVVLSADGDGTYDGPSTADQFGFGFGPLTPQAPGDFTGPVIAGDFTWTGGTLSGSLTPCTGTDATIWDPRIDLGESGTGMSSNDFFRVEDVSSPCSGFFTPGCYDFGGRPHADFYLRLFADPDCPKLPWWRSTCFPGAGGVRACPCNNPPATDDVGCNNFGPYPVGGTGGARLRAAGDPSISADTLQLVVTDMPSGGPVLTVLWQGTTVLSNGPPTGVQFGAGVRCVGGVLKRLEKANAFGGAISYPTQTFPDIHSASAAKGFPILPPVTLHYFAAYRNSAAGTPCGDAALGYNATNAGSIAWMP